MRRARSALLVVLLVSLGCSDDPVVPARDAGGDAATGSDSGDADTSARPDSSTGDSGASDADLPDGSPADTSTGDTSRPPRSVACSDAPPPGAEMPEPPLPYSGPACPALVPGENVIMSGGVERRFVLIVPDDMAEGEVLPLMFAWHYLNGSASSMLRHGRVQESANELRMIAVIPEKKGDIGLDLPIGGDVDLVWPYMDIHAGRVAEEVMFFDDMLACVAEQYEVNLSCVSTMGVSAGALWSSRLMQERSTRLSSAMIISGGVGPSPVGLSLGVELADLQGWDGAAHAMPTMVLHGGPEDGCGVDFERATNNLKSALNRDGHFVMECIHNCGHAAPPIDDPTIGLGVLYSFALDHPYWLRDGESPYSADGFPPGTPGWCDIGVGSATIRTGTCTDAMGEDNVSCPIGALKSH